jgi:hypothetical protein
MDAALKTFAAAVRLSLVALLLAGCASRLEMPAPQQAPRTAPPAASGALPRQPLLPAPSHAPQVQRSHPRYAPPPGAPAHWNSQLGVYVLEGSRLYYRERLYYRWDGDWYCAGRPEGPWERIAPVNVPPGLRSRGR